MEKSFVLLRAWKVSMTLPKIFSLILIFCIFYSLKLLEREWSSCIVSPGFCNSLFCDTRGGP